MTTRSYRLIRDLIDSWVALLKHRLVSVMAQVDEALGGAEGGVEEGVNSARQGDSDRAHKQVL
ncbi:hypothetical protein J6590_099012 [Homalodisca vitripennis]|nr:hypothetical protein J6590_099012 [Homalodisca vitripennis]